MNAQEWLVANVGKRAQMIRKFMGNPECNLPAGRGRGEKHEDILQAPSIGEHGWNLYFSCNVWCFNLTDLGTSNGNTATINCTSGSGNTFRHEFTLLE